MGFPKPLGYLISFFLFFFHLFFFILFLVYCSSGIIVTFSFLSFFNMNFDFIFVLDFLSLSFSSFVLLISCVVFVYSNFYMLGDQNLSRFFILLILFVSSMLFLVFGYNLFSLMIGWDGLGLVSFLLVIYYNNFYSLRSGLLTVLSNRLGDLGMLFSFFYFFSVGWWMNMSFSLEDFFYLGLLIIFSAMTKSAQFPFSSWLPAAMAAPTPVSSLVHSSTLVTAGVYLLIRYYYSLSFLFSSSYFCLISLATMFFSGILAILDSDIKKVIAMSTLSQLGFMMFSISLGEWIFGFFHMVCHALYKSLLFLSAGSFILFSFGSQDVRFSGGIIFTSPFFFMIFVFSSMSLFGFPFLSGFFSKDYVLEVSCLGGWSFIYLFILFVSCSFSLVYSLRLYFFGLHNYMNMFSLTSFSSFKISTFFLFLLFFWSIFSGSFFGVMIFLDNFFFIFSFLKFITLALLFMGLLIFFFFFSLYKYSNLAFEFSDFMFLYWFTGWPLSKLTKSWGLINSFELTWLELFGPKMLFNLSSFSSFLIYAESSFYKVIYLFLGVFIIFYMFYSFSL